MIHWTKVWQGIDDGTILRAIDLRNIQQDLANVVTTADVAENGLLVFYENQAVAYQNEGVFI